MRNADRVVALRDLVFGCRQRAPLPDRTRLRMAGRWVLGGVREEEAGLKPAPTSGGDAEDWVPAGHAGGGSGEVGGRRASERGAQAVRSLGHKARQPGPHVTNGGGVFRHGSPRDSEPAHRERGCVEAGRDWDAAGGSSAWRGGGRARASAGPRLRAAWATNDGSLGGKARTGRRRGDGCAEDGRVSDAAPTQEAEADGW